MNNKDLFMDIENDKLKENLLEHHDFLAVSRKIHDTLKIWYGEDYSILRNMIKDNTNKEKRIL